MTKVAVIDCKTVGFKAKDEVIGLAVVVCEVDGFGRAGKLYEWHGEREPDERIGDRALEIHGKKRGALRGKSMDLGYLEELLTGVDVLISHNARFDARVLERLLPGISEKAWRCSYRQWAWPSMENGRLETVCRFYGVELAPKYNARALLQALVQPVGRSPTSDTFLRKLLNKDAYRVRSKEALAREREERKKGSRGQDSGIEELFESDSAKKIASNISKVLPQELQSPLKRALRNGVEFVRSRLKG